MLSTLALIDHDEAQFWPTFAEIEACRRAEIAAEHIFQRKLVAPQQLSFAPQLSLAGHLREFERKANDEHRTSREEV